MNRHEMKEVIQEELEAVTKIGQPVRRPFSNYNYYNQGRYDDSFQDVTDKYNITYKAANPGEYGFNEVLYSEPHNILVAFPTEDNQDHDQPYAIFGLKAARGYGKDHRFFDRGMEGAGVFSMDEDTARSLLNNATETLKEIGSEYIKNFDMLGKPKEIGGSVVTESNKPATSKFKALEKKALDEVAEAHKNTTRARVREKIVREHAPPGWEGVAESLADRDPDTFGGQDPEINPNTVLWGVYYTAG